MSRHTAKMRKTIFTALDAVLRRALQQERDEGQKTLGSSSSAKGAGNREMETCICRL